ncbi:hypothetical protein Scep_022397 [Stephania cephalantha]|uniref:CCHC-type domain-containing protein n=2 Tax=Stephania TaxID=147243 RepID=A0AAP0HXR0_9MAGN
MGLEDFINLNASSNSCNEAEENEVQCSINGLNAGDSSHTSNQLKDHADEKNSGLDDGDGGTGDGQDELDMEIDENVIHKPLVLQEDIKIVETVSSVKRINVVNSGDISENSSETMPKRSISGHQADDTPILGVKRARVAHVDQEPSVHVKYNSLTRASKKKLEEVLQQWSEWHAQQKTSTNDTNETLESGEQTCFPALHFGKQKVSTVSFWVDNQTRKEQDKFIPLDEDAVPLYDRGFVLGLTSADDLNNLEGGVETVDSSRCFNCGSYSHSLKDCPKPRDNAAVNIARQQHKSKRGLISGPQNSSRYYQNSPGGKYDGLRPGFLGLETRKLLGLGELDPPPWLHRMREIGYPPGYLEPDDEGQPSGITIYADGKTEEDQEDGELNERYNPEPRKKKSVEFPGINAPIPENADERRWSSLAEASSYETAKRRFYSNSSRSSSDSARGHHGDMRLSRDYRDDGPPGCNNGSDLYSPPFIPRYGNNDSSVDEFLGSRGMSSIDEFLGSRGVPIPRSPSFGRSFSDRGRWNPLAHDGSPSQSPYDSLGYSSPNSHHSPHGYNSVNYDDRAHSNLHRSGSDLSSHRKGRHEHRHHHRN